MKTLEQFVIRKDNVRICNSRYLHYVFELGVGYTRKYIISSRTDYRYKFIKRMLKYEM